MRPRSAHLRLLSHAMPARIHPHQLGLVLSVKSVVGPALRSNASADCLNSTLGRRTSESNPRPPPFCWACRARHWLPPKRVTASGYLLPTNTSHNLLASVSPRRRIGVNAFFVFSFIGSEHLHGVQGVHDIWVHTLVSLRPPGRASGGLQVHRYVIITCQGMGDYGVLWRVQLEGVFVQFWDSFTVGGAQHRGGRSPW